MSDNSKNEWQFKKWVTIQEMSDNSRNEWQFKKWVTIQEEYIIAFNHRIWQKNKYIIQGRLIYYKF